MRVIMYENFKSLKTYDFAEDKLRKVILLLIMYLKERRKEKNH
jgi:hypothetical protein